MGTGVYEDDGESKLRVNEEVQSGDSSGSECTEVTCVVPSSCIYIHRVRVLRICVVAVLVYCLITRKGNYGLFDTSSIAIDTLKPSLDSQSHTGSASADPLVQANIFFQSSYTYTKESITPDVILYNQGYNLVLARNGSVVRTQSFIPASVTTLKNVAHIPLSLYLHCVRVVKRLDNLRQFPHSTGTDGAEHPTGADSSEISGSSHMIESRDATQHTDDKSMNTQGDGSLMGRNAEDSLKSIEDQESGAVYEHSLRILTSEERQFLLDFRDVLHGVDLESPSHATVINSTQKERQMQIMEMSRAFLEQLLAADKWGSAEFFTLETIHTYTESVKEMLRTNTFEAAGDLINDLHGVLSSWVGLDTNSTCVDDPRCITQSEIRNDVHVLVYGNHMAKKGSLLAVYFTELLKAPNKNGDFECFGARFVSDTNMKGLPDRPKDGVLNNFATHHADASLGDAFGFNMHRDILEEGAIAATRDLDWGGIIGD
ncbi:hypothetical protein SARC_09643 [Sphaeroforma arctica JP610]|uniref:Uncharacterized protein n=1 Tax=Sphaeroforma arctica JP610 TaxID=667725 RepID=A0A0L0FPL0_9EUKA|nr:hypothetical protein SARC_09643 [Sphaeroforma arctica JP610]KNC77908.1 hypothetical protein SARC_09643 [Sphaeroforma arctica JP610]|eukprot:XP_014151810.1 hypothetical protein SARC_09643 [Sphaeroforma arctica JP610]